MEFWLPCNGVVLCWLDSIWYERNCLIYPLEYASETACMVPFSLWCHGMKDLRPVDTFSLTTSSTVFVTWSRTSSCWMDVMEVSIIQVSATNRPRLGWWEVLKPRLACCAWCWPESWDLLRGRWRRFYGAGFDSMGIVLSEQRNMPMWSVLDSSTTRMTYTTMVPAASVRWICGSDDNLRGMNARANTALLVWEYSVIAVMLFIRRVTTQLAHRSTGIRL